MARKKSKKPEPAEKEQTMPTAPPQPPESKPKKADTRKGSRHADRHMIALDGARYELLAQMARRGNRPISWQLRDILDAAFRAEGLEPPDDTPRS